MSYSRHYQIDEQSSYLNHKFFITNEDNQIIYTVCSKSSELDDKLTLIDSSGQQLMRIWQEDPHIRLTYNIYASENDEQRLATMKRTGLPWHRKFKIESIYGQYVIDRVNGLFNREYILLRDKKRIARINRKHFESMKSYSVDIDQSVNKQEDSFILSLVVVLWCAQRIHYLGQARQT